MHFHVLYSSSDAVSAPLPSTTSPLSNILEALDEDIEATNEKIPNFGPNLDMFTTVTTFTKDESISSANWNEVIAVRRYLFHSDVTHFIVRLGYRERVARAMDSDRASIIFGAVVILNAILIGYEVEVPGGTAITGTFLFEESPAPSNLSV